MIRSELLNVLPHSVVHCSGMDASYGYKKVPKVSEETNVGQTLTRAKRDKMPSKYVHLYLSTEFTSEHIQNNATGKG